MILFKNKEFFFLKIDFLFSFFYCFNFLILGCIFLFYFLIEVIVNVSLNILRKICFNFIV